MTKSIELPDGATIEFLLDGIMRGTIPPGGVVPMHSHADPESFVVIDGEIEGLTHDRWTTLRAGDAHHVPGHVKHAWRNRTDAPTVMFLVTTPTIGRFFREIAAAPDDFLAISDRYGYWNATPGENAAVGLQITASG